MKSTKGNNVLQLEHHKQKVVPLNSFLVRMFRYTVVAMGLIVFSIAIGTIGYRHLANLPWIDSFHMSCLILTGMGPVAEMKTTGAKLFSSFYALYSGIAFLTICAVFFAPVVHRVLHILQVDAD